MARRRKKARTAPSRDERPERTRAEGAPVFDDPAPRDLPWRPAEAWLLLAVAGFVLLSRALTFPEVPAGWDGYQFALALDDYDVPRHRPHPPGYPLFVLLGKIAHLVVPDGVRAFQWLSLLFSLATLALVYLFARAMYSRRVAAAALVLLAASNVFWQYGRFPLSYTAEAFGMTLVAFAAYRARAGRGTWLGPTLALVLAAGLRPNALGFLAPVYVYALWGRPRREWAYALGTLALGIAAWAGPMVHFSGGWAEYRTASGALYRKVVWATSVFRAVSHGLEAVFWEFRLLARRVVPWIAGRGLVLATIPLVYGLGPLLRVDRLVRDPRRVILLLWLLPPLSFCLLVHVGNDGYILSFLPALTIIAAAAIFALAHDILAAIAHKTEGPDGEDGLQDRPGAPSGPRRTRLAVGMTAACLLANLALFAARDWRPPFEHDEMILGQMDYIEEHCDPGDTVLITAKWAYRPTMYYLRDFQTYWLQSFSLDPYQPDIWAGTCPTRYGREQFDQFWVEQPVAFEPILLPPEVTRVAVLGLEMAGPGVERVELGPNSLLCLIPIKPDERLLCYDRERLWFEAR